MYNENWSSFERKPLCACSIKCAGGKLHWGYDTSNGRYLSELSWTMNREVTSLVSISWSRWLTLISNDVVLCLFPWLGFCIFLWTAFPSKNQVLLLPYTCDCLCSCLLHMSYRWSDHTSPSLWSMVGKDKNHLEHSKVLRRRLEKKWI